MGTLHLCPICGHDPWAGNPPVGPHSGGVFVPCGHQLEARLAEIEAEEAAGLRKFVFEEWEMRDASIEALYTEFPKPAGAGVSPLLPDVAKRVRELEARGYYLWGPRFLRGFFGPVLGKMAETRVFMYRAERPEDVPRHTVRAIRCVIEEAEPSWITTVAQARRYSDDVGVLSAWTELPAQAVMASLEVLKAQRQ